MRRWISPTSASVAARIGALPVGMERNVASAMDDDALMLVLREAAEAVRNALNDLGELGSWGLAGTRPGQYQSDLAADPAALRVLVTAGCGVLSEETGLHHPDRDLIVIVDPVDGSTNASRGIPWF